MRLALEGIRVMDFSRVVSGPYCTMMLADMGADVIKIEEPGRGDESRGYAPILPSGESSDFISLNRNKKSITVNLKSAGGKEIVRRLARVSDILVENFKVGNMDRLGLGYEQLRRINPRLIYCGISGYGEEGPYRDRPAYDLMIAGYAGLQSMTGEPNGPPIAPGIPVSDSYGSLHAAVGILTALYNRTVSGEGQKVSIALLDSQLAVELQVTGKYFTTGQIHRRQPVDNLRPQVTPYGTFETATIYINVGVINQRLWASFCQILGRPELGDDPRLESGLKRVANKDDLLAIIKPILRTRPGEEWLDLFNEAGIPCSPINSLDRVVSDEQVLQNGMVVSVEHPTCGTVKVLGTPLNLSATPGGVRTPPPLLGQHNEDVLTTLLGYGPEDVAQLRAEGAI